MYNLVNNNILLFLNKAVQKLP